ncbi:hypothetical protein L1049_012231 [Liquidambar formosana]|uniref:Cytochrome P450 n=1 Tax=Liquidambar formosana TaxID=63359 RepID=A0AAP0X358_LIQFO
MAETFQREIYLFFGFVLLLHIIFHILKHIRSPLLKRKPLPPGPHPWPIIGNIPHMGKKPHISMAHVAEVHGPLISLRLGTQLLVIGSSPAAATEILKTHDRLLSARCVPQAIPLKGDDLDRLPLIWGSGSGDRWKFLRALCRAELFTPNAIESQSTLRERKVNEMLSFLGTNEGKVVNIGEVVFTTVFNTLANLIFSKDFISLEDVGPTSGLKGIIWRLMELGIAPNISDFYPILSGLDLQGLNKEFSELINKVYDVWEVLIKERRESRCHDALKQQDFLDAMLANEFANDQINFLALELFAAGTDTITTTVEWAMAELLKNKEVMDKVCEELRREFSQNSITKSSIPQLQYLDACVKETLRLHPPAPLLLPHRALETCEVMNYTIPKNSRVFVNIWAIGRDPTIWEDPLLFTPERFLSSNIDFKGQHFEFLPFSAGRRMCPGLPMATRQVHLILASLIHSFEWSLPNNEDPALLDMNEKFGITLQKELPLLLIPKQKV